jgi:hypothetical protein
MVGVKKRRDTAFVFVLCGAAEYIETLNYSLAALARFSRSRILVVTDTARNELPINAPEIIDIRTPSQYSNHEASIYLKTGVHKFVPEGPLYCYLDTDVVAISREVDTIFQRYQAPVTFAPDHSVLRDFSPYTVRCGCAEIHDEEALQVQKLIQYIARREEALKAKAAAEAAVQEQPVSVIGRALSKLGLRKSPPPPPQIEIPEEDWSGWQWDKQKKTWITPTGRDAYHLECEHLIPAAREKFGIEITDAGWQHWNGGVFLFDERSKDFLDAWHERSMQAAADPYWKTRDQGTLIVTAWAFGLMNHPTLPRKYNFLLDAGGFNNGASFMETVKQAEAAGAEGQKQLPLFCHVFLRFGDPDWDVWQWIDARVRS